MTVQSNTIRTSIPVSLAIFLAVIMALCGGFFVAMLLIDFSVPFKVIGYIFTVGFFLFAGAMLLDLLFHFQVVEGEYLHNRIFFTHRKIKMKDIDRITRSPTHYTVFTKGKPFCSLNVSDPSTDKMLYQFERHGFNLGKIQKVDK